MIYIFIIILSGLLILTPLNYFDIFNNTIATIIKIIIPILAFFIGGVLIGKKSQKKGWLEGIKLSMFVIILFILISYIGFNESFKLKSLIFYITLIISSILGSIIGINKKIDN